MAVKNIILAIPLTSVASSGLSGAYSVINTAGIPNACFLLMIVNNSSKDVTVSYDGTNDHDFVPSLTTRSVNGQTNAQPNNFIANFPVGLKVYVKGTAGTGNVYLVGYYQPSVG